MSYSIIVYLTLDNSLVIRSRFKDVKTLLFVTRKIKPLGIFMGIV